MLNPGIKIYQVRNQKGWTQSELAAKAGLAQANLSNIEKGKRDFTVSMLLRLARALEVRPSELIEEAPVPKSLKFRRSQIETLARAVADPRVSVSRDIREAADLFRRVSSEADSGRGDSAQKVQWAWTQLRQQFSSEEIRGVFQRIEDARQRDHA